MVRFFVSNGIGFSAKLSFPVFINLRWRRDVAIGNRTSMDRFSVLDCDASGEISIGENCYIGRHSILKTYRGAIKIGNETSINAFCLLNGAGGLVIGDGVRIASHCSIVASNHVFEDIQVLIKDQGVTARGIEIGDNVWIGTGVRILDGVRIGRGAVVAAGAVVTRSVQENAVVGGVPARLIKFRS